MPTPSAGCLVFSFPLTSVLTILLRIASTLFIVLPGVGGTPCPAVDSPMPLPLASSVPVPPIRRPLPAADGFRPCCSSWVCRSRAGRGAGAARGSPLSEEGVLNGVWPTAESAAWNSGEGGAKPDCRIVRAARSAADVRRLAASSIPGEETRRVSAGDCMVSKGRSSGCDGVVRLVLQE